MTGRGTPPGTREPGTEFPPAVREYANAAVREGSSLFRTGPSGHLFGRPAFPIPFPMSGPVIEAPHILTTSAHEPH